MLEVLHTIELLAIFAAAGSVCYDLATYPRRQDEWERRFPGQTYQRHYRRQNNKGHSR